MLVLLFLAWIVFNGRITLEIVVIGLLVSGGVFAFVCKFMDYNLYREVRFYKRASLFGKYIVLLIRDVILANLSVFHLMLSRRETVEPSIVCIHTDIKSETLRVMLANYITLTPGTITVSLREDTLIIHCLDKSLAEGIEDSPVAKLLKQIESEVR